MFKVTLTYRQIVTVLTGETSITQRPFFSILILKINSAFRKEKQLNLSTKVKSWDLRQTKSKLISPLIQGHLLNLLTENMVHVLCVIFV